MKSLKSFSSKYFRTSDDFDKVNACDAPTVNPSVFELTRYMPVSVSPVNVNAGAAALPSAILELVDVYHESSPVPLLVRVPAALAEGNVSIYDAFASSEMSIVSDLPDELITDKDGG